MLQHAADVKLQIYAVYACSSSAQGNVEQAQAGAAVPSSAYPRKDPQVPLFNARCSVFPRRTETQRATEPFVADRHISPRRCAWQHTCSSRLSTEGFWQLCSPGLVLAVMSYVTMCETSPNTAEAFKLGEFQDSFELANKALEVRGERPRTLIARFAVWARLTPSTLRARSSLSSSRHTSPRSEGVPTEQFASQAPGTSVAQTCSLTPSGCSFRGRRKLAGCLQLRAGALKGCCALHSENGTTPLPTMPPARSRTCMAAST